MRKFDDSNLVGVGLFFRGGGNIVPIDRVKYLRRLLLLIDDVGSKISAVGYKVDLLLYISGDNLAVNDEGGRRRR